MNTKEKSNKPTKPRIGVSSGEPSYERPCGEQYFKTLMALREKNIDEYHKSSKTVRNILKQDIKKWDTKIINCIEHTIDKRLDLTEEMTQFKTFYEILKIEKEKESSNNKNQANSLNKNNSNDNAGIEQFNNEHRVAINKIKEISAINKQQRTTIKYLKKYKTGHLTDKKIQNIVDSNRMKNGRINYTAAGKVIGISKDTIRKLIKDRNLNWLIGKPDSYTPPNK